MRNIPTFLLVLFLCLVSYAPLPALADCNPPCTTRQRCATSNRCVVIVEAGGVCTTRDQCPDPATYICQPSTVNGVTQGRCVLDTFQSTQTPSANTGSGTCTISADCPVGSRYCISGQCYPQCATTGTPSQSTCPTGSTCRSPSATPQAGDLDGYCDDNASGTQPPSAGQPTAPSGARGGCPTEGLINALQVCTLEDLIAAVLDAVVQIGAIFLTLALVWVGFLFASAGGNEEKIKKARESLYWSVIGGLMLLGAEAISLAIKGFVNAL